MLEVLTEAGIDCEVVTGTSAGALIGAAYCCGKLASFKEKAMEISLTDIPSLLSPSWSLQGLFSGKNALEFLNDSLTVDLIEELPKKFGATAVDLLSGDLVEFKSGEIRSVLRSTISIPALFTPVASEGRLLVDGGLIDVLPIHLARELGAEFVIAIDLYGSTAESPVPLVEQKKGIQNALAFISEKMRGKRSKRMNLISVIESTFAAIQKNSTQMRLKEFPADLLIQPAVLKVGVLDFHRAQPVIEIGRIAALEALPRLQAALRDSEG